MRAGIVQNLIERDAGKIGELHFYDRTPAMQSGSDGGAEHWAVIASLIESCKLLGVEPHGYIADVITRIVNRHPQTRLDDLLPWEYPVMRPLQVVA